MNIVNFLWRALPRKIADLSKLEDQNWPKLAIFWPQFDSIAAFEAIRPANRLSTAGRDKNNIKNSKYYEKINQILKKNHSHLEAIEVAPEKRRQDLTV